MNETTQRFLRDVVGKLGAAEVVELRLFPAIRQGGIESAVAVIAVEPAAPVNESEPPVTDGESAPSSDVAAGPIAEESVNPDFEEAALAHSPAEADRAAGERGDTTSGASEGDALLAVSSTNGAHPTPDSASPYADDDSPYADDQEGAPASDTVSDVEGDELPTLQTERARPAARDAVQRLAIMTARYRHVFKGPDRGKWEVDLVHEADAPLATVERVARGVARRAGDALDPEHFSGESLRYALEQPAWDIAT